MIDTRDLAEKREELQTNLVNSFNEYFETEIGNFDELIKHIDNSDNKDVEEWRDDKVYDFEHIDEINELEDEITEFPFGETLIPEDDFEYYCEELMEEFGYINKDTPQLIKNNIDYKGIAEDMKYDYTEVTYQGNSYLGRA